MRVDDFLSTVGVIKRRTIDKQLADAGMIEVKGNKAKAAYVVKVNDIIVIKGASGRAVEVLALPGGSVPKTDREKYFRELKR